MSKKKDVGVFQLKNGNWGFRYGVVVEGKTIWKKKTKDINGRPLKTKSDAIKARSISIAMTTDLIPEKQKSHNVTVSELWSEYRKHGMKSKAYATIRKQESLWTNHISIDFGKRQLNSFTAMEINDYLFKLYYDNNYSFQYVGSFLKLFYLIFGQAYSRDYISTEYYAKLCRNKDTRIKMPKQKSNEQEDVVIFNSETMLILDNYFKGTNAETAYMLGKHCGLRISECYGLLWDNVDLENRCITIDRQLQYQDGIIKLVAPKTKNAYRTIYMSDELYDYFVGLHNHVNQIRISLSRQREQNQTIISNIDGSQISNLNLVNTLDNGKIQTVNSMKYHSRQLKELYNIDFKYHYLRHTYGSSLANRNIPAHILKMQMGHGSITVTNKYYVSIDKEGVTSLVNCLNTMYK